MGDSDRVDSDDALTSLPPGVHFLIVIFVMVILSPIAARPGVATRRLLERKSAEMEDNGAAVAVAVVVEAMPVVVVACGTEMAEDEEGILVKDRESRSAVVGRSLEKPSG